MPVFFTKGKNNENQRTNTQLRDTGLPNKTHFVSVNDDWPIKIFLFSGFQTGIITVEEGTCELDSGWGRLAGKRTWREVLK